MRQVTIPEFHAELRAQGVSSREHLAFRCPLCKTLQSARDLIDAGAGKTFDEVESSLGFACVGRFTGAGSPRKKPDGKPCNWTLGGLFRLHELEVIDENGKAHARFEPASPEDAKAHERRREPELATPTPTGEAQDDG